MVWNSNQLTKYKIIKPLTFFANLFNCLVPFHHVITASGLDPELLHSTSYRLSADTDFSFVKICTAAGFTRKLIIENYIKGKQFD